MEMLKVIYSSYSYSYSVLDLGMIYDWFLELSEKIKVNYQDYLNYIFLLYISIYYLKLGEYNCL